MEFLEEMFASRKRQTKPTDKIFGISERQIANRIQAAAEHAGLEGRFRGHSPRVGMAVQLAHRGLQPSPDQTRRPVEVGHVGADLHPRHHRGKKRHSSPRSRKTTTTSMTMMTSHPGAKMSNHTQPPAEIAQAAWQAAGLKQNNFGDYKSLWSTWEEWCDAECINPLAATHDDFEAFVADQEFNAAMRMRYSTLLFQPYRSVGKTNPARRPTSQSKASIDGHAPLLKRFQSWCKANNASYLPARHQDVVAFLTELAKTYPQSYLKLALSAIARMHTDAGYTPPSHEPEVTSALKHLKGTPRQLVTDSQATPKAETDE